MGTQATRRLVTPRDIEILTALDRCPLTAIQLLKISETFALPFTNERRVRERLLHLCDAGRVCRWQYATAGQGSPNYYTLSRLGFRLLHDDDALPATRRAFEPVGLSMQHHTQSLADFIVHTAVSAHRRGIAFTGFYRENTLRLAIGEESLYPDSGWDLIEAEQFEYGYFVEIDEGTERVRSSKDIESWERKIRFYDRLLDVSPKKFRVLAVTTRSGERLSHILEAAGKLMRNPNRSLIYGISLPEYLGQADPLKARCFRDHRGNPVALVPERIPTKPAWSPLPMRALPPRRLSSLTT
jgi:hypothetical protein